MRKADVVLDGEDSRVFALVLLFVGNASHFHDSVSSADGHAFFSNQESFGRRRDAYHPKPDVDPNPARTQTCDRLRKQTRHPRRGRIPEMAPTGRPYRRKQEVMNFLPSPLGRGGGCGVGASETQAIVSSPNSTSPQTFIRLIFIFLLLRETVEAYISNNYIPSNAFKVHETSCAEGHA